MTVESSSNFKLRSQTYDYYDGKNWGISSDFITLERGIDIEWQLLASQQFRNNDIIIIF